MLDPEAYIANRDLRRSDVPELRQEVAQRPYVSPAWDEVWTFALSFRGYVFFGDDEGALTRLSEFDRSVREAFDRDGGLPKLDLALLRACLFWEQRAWCKGVSDPGDKMDAQSVEYIRALLGAIRAAIN